MLDESKIAAHTNPAVRERTNYIARLDLAGHGMPGHYEQVWTRRTEDHQGFELCCIPFFTYGLSLGDTLAISEDGAHELVAKSGHRTIRYAITDDTFAHEGHEELHGALTAIGSMLEFRGHAHGYAAIDIADPTQADSVVALLVPLAESNYLEWEWADPVVGD